MKIVYALWILLVFICEASHFVIFPSQCGRLYGSEMGSMIFSMMYFSRAGAAGIGIFASSIILPNYSWIPCF
jgi:hypothetical protein